MHRFTIIQYVRSTRAYNIPSILLVFERTISCKITPLVIPIIPLSTVPRRQTPEKRVFLYSVLQSRQYVSNSTQLVPALLILLPERMSRRSTQCTRYATKTKDESSEMKRKTSEMAKNNHRTVPRVQGFNTFHLVQRKNYDLYCSCVYCSRRHHTNAKTKLSNRAGLSFLCGTCCA